LPRGEKGQVGKRSHKLVKGNIKKIIFAHDTVRVVECLMALGTQEIKDALFDELKEDINEMSKSKYASFFCPEAPEVRDKGAEERGDESDGGQVGQVDEA